MFKRMLTKINKIKHFQKIQKTSQNFLRSKTLKN